MRWQQTEYTASIPLRLVGPVALKSVFGEESLQLPLATLESPLWHSVHRGARVCTRAGGIHATVLDDRMTRSVLVEAPSAALAADVSIWLSASYETMASIVSNASRFARLLRVHVEQLATMLYIRFEFTTGDASGHNMTTLAAERLLAWILREKPSLSHLSVSGNYCVDKKVSAINGILGRGKKVVAEVTISRELSEQLLRTTPEKIVELNIKKNLLGSLLAGGVRSANAHYANMLLGFYLATGQDAANLVEGSQGITYAEVHGDALYFSVTLPNMIVGTVGNGKNLPYVQEVLKTLGCLEERAPSENAKRLAIIGAASVLCGELSLLAAQTNPGELIDSHVKLERRQRRHVRD